MAALKLPLASLKNPKKIECHRDELQFVVAVDESKSSRHAFTWADFLADPTDKISVIHSAENDKQLKIVQDRYSKFENEKEFNKNQRYNLNILDDYNMDINQRIIHFVNKKSTKIDMLVTGSYGQTVENHPDKLTTTHKFGSTADISLRRALCSSLFVRRTVEVPKFQKDLKICVGVDGSQNSFHAFEFAVQLLQQNNTLLVCHIETSYSGNPNVPQEYLSKNVINKYMKFAEFAKKDLKFDVNIQVQLIEDYQGTIASGLCSYVSDKKCHILCVGADGMTAFLKNEPILGSVSDECVQTCKTANVIVTQINEFASTPRQSMNSFYDDKDN